MASIAWLPWSAESFGRARSDGRPVLLFIAPSWCQYSHEMDATSLADDDVCRLVTSRFVPVRVDADRRPDLSDRYGLGGWPTTAFLTPDGVLIGGGTYIDAPRLADILVRVSDAFASGRHLVPRPARAPQPHESAPPIVEDLLAAVLDTYDSTHGGFGDSPKFPHAGAVRLTLALFKETGREQYGDIATTSLDAMGWGPLYDDAHGGFFAYSQDADWGRPNQAKLLSVNASLLSLYVDAFETFGLSRYAQRAEDVLRYVQTWLADPLDGGWAASQRADHDYYATSSGDAAPDAPAVDRALYADWNGAMISAALNAGRALDDTSLSELAIKSLERILLLAYRPGAGVAHHVDDRGPQVRGLLDDQIAMAAASLDAFEATGNVVYQMMAEELALYAVRAMWDEARGGFFDRVADPRRDVGLLREPVKPFVGNCAAARTLFRVAETAGSSELRDHAERALAAMAGRAAAQGPAAAEYLLALRPPVQR